MCRSFSVALVGHQQIQCLALFDQLAQMRCIPLLFASAGKFLSALAGGRRFDLLAVMPQDESRLESLLSACGVLGIPVLLIGQSPQWDSQLPSPDEGFAWGRVMALPVSKISKTALDSCLRTLLPGADVGAQAVRTDDRVWGDYRFADDGSQQVLHRDRDVRLQPREFAFALALFRHMGRVLTRDELWNSIWRDSRQVKAARTIDVCAANLRRKLELRSENGFLLRGVYGQGYLLVAVRPFVPEMAPGGPLLNGFGAQAAPPPIAARHAWRCAPG